MADSSNDTDAYETYDLGDWKLQSGQIIPQAILAYKTFGNPGSPAIIYLTWYSGEISSNVWLIGADKTLNPEKYFIIIPALFGNGQSSSPSNCPNLGPFPDVTMYDNVRAQHKLVTEHFGITHARAVLGWSMGSAQTFQWITQYPDFADLAVPFCGAARCALHNQVFLEGAKAALLAPVGHMSAGSKQGTFDASGKQQQPRKWTPEARKVGLKAFGRVYAGWGFSQTFYRQKVYEQAPYSAPSLEAFMINFWEAWALSKDPENLLTMLHTWQAADITLQPNPSGSHAADPHGPDHQESFFKSFEEALGSIKSKTLVLPSETDLYFPPEDSEIEVKHMKEGTGLCRAFPSIWGHWAGGPGDSVDDVKWLDEQLREWFEGPGVSTESEVEKGVDKIALSSQSDVTVH